MEQLSTTTQNGPKSTYTSTKKKFKKIKKHVFWILDLLNCTCIFSKGSKNFVFEILFNRFFVKVFFILRFILDGKENNGSLGKKDEILSF
jgi:hypothetical protein